MNSVDEHEGRHLKVGQHMSENEMLKYKAAKSFSVYITNEQWQRNDVISETVIVITFQLISVYS